VKPSLEGNPAAAEPLAVLHPLAVVAPEAVVWSLVQESRALQSLALSQVFRLFLPAVLRAVPGCFSQQWVQVLEQ